MSIVSRLTENVTYDLNECNWDAVETAVSSATCTKDLITSGELPPGLDFPGCDNLYLSGTPTHPGMWRATIRVPDYVCSCGTTPAQDVSVVFTIEGDAPRRIRR